SVIIPYFRGSHHFALSYYGDFGDSPIRIIIGILKNPYNIGKYIFDYDNQALKIGGTTKRITEKESEILRYLCNNKNKLVKRDELLIAVWGVNDYFLGRSLDVFITKIRKYLKEDSDITIENIHGVGFILNTEKS
ncbi:MAG: winged helix-turn-helix domain-containing protein, partial [Bacteroidia bacterium]